MSRIASPIRDRRRLVERAETFPLSGVRGSGFVWLAPMPRWVRPPARRRAGVPAGFPDGCAVTADAGACESPCQKTAGHLLAGNE
jgi:hypothetical protein